jgi:hypothetical protein
MFELFILFLAAHPMFSKQSPAKSSLVKISKSTVEHIHDSPNSSQFPVIKSEPRDEDEALRYLHSPSVKKGKERRISSPIVISSDESDVSTPKPKVAKIDNSFSSDKLKKRYVRCPLSPFPFSYQCVVLLQPRIQGIRKRRLCGYLAPRLFQTAKATLPLASLNLRKALTPSLLIKNCMGDVAHHCYFASKNICLSHTGWLVISAPLPLTSTSVLRLFLPLLLHLYQSFS